MRVLFAVNDENISTSIAKKYQKQYKEIISYKNVYYFNAILKELQRNKEYDRIVISEDLEEFTSTSLEQKDKFIFDKLDSISDEAVSPNGTDIPIILICSERRNKSEDILVKLFGISIYNAIIGTDRSTEEVCRLINKPRSKKEAKIYYKIDTENVGYDKKDDSDVSETEMRNILIHFKKIGNDEDKYAESFRNIVSQYNKEQLKVIIAILPQNVRDVLEETSPEYQEIMSIDKRSITKAASLNTKNKVARKNKKGPSEKLLDVEQNQIMSQPVVVPTTIDKNMKVNIEKKKKIDVADLELEEDYDDIQEIEEIKPKRRGRPRKNAVVEEPIKEEKESVVEEKPKKRGRPKKVVSKEPEQSMLPGFEEDEDEETAVLPGFEEEDENTNQAQKDYNYATNSSYRNDDEEDNDEYYDEDEDEDDDYKDYTPKKDSNYLAKNNNEYQREMFVSKANEISQYDNVFDDDEFQALLTSEKKVATFVGTSKNGTSFVVNNVAHILASMGVNTAILDATKNKNSYYTYTNDDEILRQKAANSIKGLIQGRRGGIDINSFLTVYTGIPTQKDEINNSHPILETLVKNHSIVLIDCDFDTPIEYFDKSQEIYLIQSMDVLTIQPLTEFLRELQLKNVLDESKLRIILNKMLRLKRVNGAAIVGGMSKYNNPDMSLMKDLFNPKVVRTVAQFPFDEDVYVKYLESLIDCEIKLDGYPKEFKVLLRRLAEVIYPLLPNDNNSKKNKKSKQANNKYSNSFSSGMNNTLNNMRNKY